MMASEVGRRAIRAVRNLPEAAAMEAVGTRFELRGAFYLGVIDGVEGTFSERVFKAYGERPTDALRERRQAYERGYIYGKVHAEELVA